MSKLFTVDEARAVLPQVRERSAEIISLRADLTELSAAVRRGEHSPTLGGLPELKALEARLHEHLSWFAEQGVELKGIAPLLIDFPAIIAGEDVLLCWLEGESELGWYHRREYGFAGRRRLDVEV